MSDDHEFEPVCCDGCGSTYCAGCGGCTWGCVDYGEDDPDRPCSFCGEQDCDGSGYNCPDEVYATYNEGLIDVGVDQ
jgi:hypothetical protein